MNFFKTKKYSLAGGTKSKSKAKKETRKKEGVVAISETEKYQVNRNEVTKQKNGKKKKAPAPPQPAATIVSEEPLFPNRTTERITLGDNERVLEASIDVESDRITKSGDNLSYTYTHSSTGEMDTAKENASVTESDATDFSDGHVSKELEAIANEQSNKSSAIEFESDFPSTDPPEPISSLYEDIRDEYLSPSKKESISDRITMEESSRM